MEIEAVSAGLALLGINDFSGMPVKPRPFLHAGITAIPVCRKQNVPSSNNNDAAVEVVDMQQFLTQAGPPGPQTVVSHPFTPLSSQAAGLLVQKLDPTQVSVTIKREANNNTETKGQDQERGRRKRIQTNPGLDSTDNDEIELEGSPVTGQMEVAEAKIECEDCGSVLRSEWHRHPSRHDCKADSGVTCPDCGSLLRSSWYLPPSRHSCLPPAPHNPSPDTQGQGLRPRKKRSLSLSHEENIREAKTPKAYAEQVETAATLKVEDREESKPKFFSCPLDGCSRKCETNKLLMLHLAMSHFLVKMESKYISSADCVILEDGRRKCPHCDKVQPAHKLGFIRHVSMEHEEVMENLTRKFMDKLAKEKEAKKDTTSVEELSVGKTEDKNQTETSKTDETKDHDGPTTDLSSDKEKAIIECDPMIE